MNTPDDDSLRMAACMEIHDATIMKAESNEKALILELEACIHRSSGTPGVDAGSTWRARIQIEFGLCTPRIDWLQLPAELCDGVLWVNENCHNGIVPLPLNEHGRIVADLELCDGRKLKIAAVSVRADVLGEMEYLDDFPG